MGGFLLALGICIIINALFFAFAASRRSDAVTDLSYGLSFALAATALVLVYRAWDPIRLAAALMVIAWAARLASYLFGRILSIKVDHRFDGMRENVLRFARFWFLQAVSVAVILLPLIAVLSNPPPHLSFLHPLGGGLLAFGLVVEAVADAQKSAWKRRGEKSFVRAGLWAWSRHPNYFGEILVWIGLWVYAIPSLSGLWFLSIIGPLYISLLLVFVTGLPPLEKSAEARYGSDPAYVEYRKATSILIPLPPRKGAPKEAS